MPCLFLHDSLESADENEVRFASFGKLRPVHSNSEPNAALVNDAAPGYDIPPKNAKVFKPSAVPKNDMVFENAKAPDATAVHVNALVPDSNEYKVDGSQNQCTATEKKGPAVPDGPRLADDSKSFTDTSFHAECFMVLKETQHCEHLSYCGGDEKQIHRGANGHTRHLTCKQCDKTVICGRRREAIQMWSYLVQVALCTKVWQQAQIDFDLPDLLQRTHKDAGGQRQAEGSWPCCVPWQPWMECDSI